MWPKVMNSQWKNESYLVGSTTMIKSQNDRECEPE